MSARWHKAGRETHILRLTPDSEVLATVGRYMGGWAWKLAGSEFQHATSQQAAQTAARRALRESKREAQG